MKMNKQLKWVHKRTDVLQALRQYSFHHDLNRFREPQKQQEAMLKVMERDKETYMALVVHQNTIIGYTIVLPPEPNERWKKLNYLKVLGVIEISTAYRGHKIGQRLLQTLFKHSQLEDYIVVSLEYCWHWDLSMTDGDPFRYMNMLKHVLQSSGFQEYETNEPDIALYDVNFMMAKIGANIFNEQIEEFKKLAKPY